MSIFEQTQRHIQDLLRYITYFFELTPFIFCLVNYKNVNMAKDKRVFFYYSIFVTLFILTGIYIRYYLLNMPQFFVLTRIYDIVEYLFLSTFLSLNAKNAVAKKIIAYSIIPFFIFCAYDFLKSTEPSFAFLPLVVECLLLLSALLYILYEKMTFTFEVPIYQTSFFWIAVAFVVYSAGNFFLFLFSSEGDYKDPAFKLQYAVIYSFVTILKNIFLCIGVFITDKTVKKDTMRNINLDITNPFKTA